MELISLPNITDKLIRQQVDIDEMWFGFMPDVESQTRLILRQLQEKHLAKRRICTLHFVDLEKALDLVPRDVVGWGLRKLGVEERLLRVVQSM